jgi:hypothetical protein
VKKEINIGLGCGKRPGTLMSKGIIYYTDSRLGEPIRSAAQKLLLQTGLPISSSSLEPMAFGDNVVLKNAKRSYPTMVKQIIMALENSEEDVVFFCEHDVLYHPSHFKFTPEKDNVFYYNENVWRWRMWDDVAITYDRMLPLSAMCVNRQFALDHYKLRLKTIEKWGWDKERSREPRWVRRMGYEPGTKKRKRGGITDDDFDTWRSKFPLVDLRHKGSFSRPKVQLEEFKHAPKNWKEVPYQDIPGWDLAKLFKS